MHGMVSNNMQWYVMLDGHVVMDTNSPFVPVVGDRLDIFAVSGDLKVIEREVRVTRNGMEVYLHTEQV